MFSNSEANLCCKTARIKYLNNVMSIIILQILKLKYFVQEAVKLFKEHFHPILPFVIDHIEVEIRQEQYDACKYMTPTYQSQT
jgi:SPX domain protein involved in polyphosphate accumulation